MGMEKGEHEAKGLRPGRAPGSGWWLDQLQSGCAGGWWTGSQRGSNRRTRPSGDRGTRLGGALVRYSGPCGNQLIEPGRRRPEIRRGGNLGVGAATGEGKCAGGGIFRGRP
jgi:hypothetical protein